MKLLATFVAGALAVAALFFFVAERMDFPEPQSAATAHAVTNMVLGANPDQEFALQPIDQLLVLPCDAEWLIRPVLVHVSGKLAVPAALSAGRTTNSQAR